MIRPIESTHAMGDGEYLVCFGLLGYTDYKEKIVPWAEENLVYGIDFEVSAAVRLYHPGDFALFMLRWG